MGADSLAKNTPNASKISAPNICPSPKVQYLKKSSLWVSVVRDWRCHKSFYIYLKPFDWQGSVQKMSTLTHQKMTQFIGKHLIGRGMSRKCQPYSSKHDILASMCRYTYRVIGLALGHFRVTIFHDQMKFYSKPMIFGTNRILTKTYQTQNMSSRCTSLAQQEKL